MMGKCVGMKKGVVMGVKRVFGAVLVLILLSGCEAGNAGEDVPAYLVAVSAQGTWGSGIVYSVDGETLNVLTAAHVVKGAQPIEDEGNGGFGSDCVDGGSAGQVTVRFCDGCEIVCADVVVSDAADVAMVRIPVSEISEKRQRQYQCVKTDKESFDKLQAGDGCAAVGIGAGAETVRCEGSILDSWIYMEDYGQYMIWAQAGIQSGMSGGGLFDSQGCFIGLLSGGSGDGELAAVPLGLILQFDMDATAGR